MKKIQILGFALFAVFACGALVASSAFAVSEFLVSGAAPTAQVAVDSETNGNLLLEDTSTLLGKANVVCTGVTNLGFVGETVGGVFDPKLDLVEAVIFIVANCLPSPVSNACLRVVAVQAVNLGWLTDLILVGGVTFLDLHLKDDGVTGAPGYLIECEVLGGGIVDDTCTTEAGTTTIDNNGIEDIVALFNAPTEEERASCTQGNAKSGVVEGEVLILTESGLGLTVS